MNQYSNIKKIKVSDLEQGLLETSVQPKGNWRTSWIMRLSCRPEKCRIPRGFGYLSGKYI